MLIHISTFAASANLDYISVIIIIIKSVVLDCFFFESINSQTVIDFIKDTDFYHQL